MSDPNDPSSNPYGQPPADNPYGQPQQPPYGAPGPYGRGDPDKRPGTVLAAGIITIALSSIALLLWIVLAIGVAVARDDVIDRLRQDGTVRSLSAGDVVSIILVVVAVLAIWSAIAMVLGVLALKRSQFARIALVVSAAVTAVVSLVAIGALVSAITLIGAVAVIVLLFTGGAGDWFARRGRADKGALPVGTTQPWG